VPGCYTDPRVFSCTVHRVVYEPRLLLSEKMMKRPVGKQQDAQTRLLVFALKYAYSLIFIPLLSRIFGNRKNTTNYFTFLIKYGKLVDKLL
jgi:hypothetical protein